MKYIISFFLFFQSMNILGQDNGIVLIKHIGISDKPIPTVVISAKEICSSSCIHSILSLDRTDIFFRKVVADTNLINALFQSLQKEGNVITEPSQSTYMFGSFEIDYLNNNCQKEITKFFIDRKKSIVFFKSVIKKISELQNGENSELVQALTNLVKRIEY